MCYKRSVGISRPLPFSLSDPPPLLACCPAGGARWLQGLSLPANIGDVDSALFHSQYTKYRAAVSGSGSDSGSGEWHNISVTLDTSEVRGFQFWARAQLGWPQLVARRRLRFGVTQVRQAGREAAAEPGGGFVEGVRGRHISSSRLA